MSYGRPSDNLYDAHDEWKGAILDPLPQHRGRTERRIGDAWVDEADVPDPQDAA